MIFHIVKKDKWDTYKSNTYYKPHSLEREGYIHCSFVDQIMKVADTFHKNQKDLLVIVINSKKLGNKLKVEDLFNLKEKYPHVYGVIPMNAIEKIVELMIDEHGDFIKPNLDPVSSLFVEQREWT